MSLYVCAMLRRSSRSGKLDRHMGVPCGPREQVVEKRLNRWQRLGLLPDANVLKLATLRVGLIDQLLTGAERGEAVILEVQAQLIEHGLALARLLIAL